MKIDEEQRNESRLYKHVMICNMLRCFILKHRKVIQNSVDCIGLRNNIKL